MPREIAVPSYDELSAKYEDLMGEWSEERPDTPHGALSYIELVSNILVDELVSRHREEGGILRTKRDLGYALDLLTGVRNWVNHLDLVDAMEQERAFLREHPEQRGRIGIDPLSSETIDPALRSTESSTATDWPDLHRRWADLAARIEQIEQRRKGCSHKWGDG